MALVLGVVAIVLLTISVLISPADASFGLRAVYLVAQWTGPLLLVAAVALAMRHRCAEWIRRRLVELAGPALISAMPPRTVLNSVLARVLGDTKGLEEFVPALLGGSGRDLGARDTAISRETVVDVRFERIDGSNCLTEIVWSHEFSGVRNNHHFVMFATTDANIMTAINRDRVYPLFESWRVDNDDQLANFVPSLKAQLDVGVSYRDVEGDLHVVEPKPVSGEEVALNDYAQFVRLPRSVDPQNLVIFHLDLYDLTDPDIVVGAIERLQLRTSTIGSFEQGYLNWSAPHPCFVEKVVFDVRRLAQKDETLVYQVFIAALKKADTPYRGTWTRASDRIEVSIDSWMLAGHGVTLVWRPVAGTESSHAPDRW